ncbi:tyrosine-protein kinase Fer-like isoform X2 [Ptychodera flava]|uniref:tyrosine-protein kinase Fer-like isoform X2 n=1 Tax=Ptychodera flava TaxID=63121 RepID=UPI00396A3B6A
MPVISKPFNFPPAHELKRSDITTITKLGEGNFGSVEKAKLRNLGGQPGAIEVAVKYLKLEEEAAEEKEIFDKELKVASSIEYHPNVITFIGFVTVEDPMLLVFEFAKQGELLNYLRERKDNGISQDKLVKFTLDVANGMSYLSSKAIIHRDLAARNILVSGDTCKISDFGFSRLGEIYVKMSKDGIPIFWTAPECLVAKGAKYNTKTDVWSYGVLMWEIMSLGERPYSSGLKDRIKQYLEGGGRLTKPKGCPDNIYEVMKKCWQLNQNDRPTFRRLANEIDAIHCDLTDQDDYEVVEVGAQLPAVDGYDDITVHIP